jgi:hypothetical protein
MLTPLIMRQPDKQLPPQMAVGAIILSLASMPTVPLGSELQSCFPLVDNDRIIVRGVLGRTIATLAQYPDLGQIPKSHAFREYPRQKYSTPTPLIIPELVAAYPTSGSLFQTPGVAEPSVPPLPRSVPLQSRPLTVLGCSVGV